MTKLYMGKRQDLKQKKIYKISTKYDSIMHADYNVIIMHADIANLNTL